jgi:hypothetical protein
MAAEARLWAVADELVDRAPAAADLRAHGLQLLAARRLRARGLPVPVELAADERRAAIATLAVPALLQRVRAAYDGPVMVMKGPEVASRYPDPALRPYKDLDLLTDDAAEAQRALIAAGFYEFGPPDEYDRKQHLHPLAWPGLPITIELHHVPLWVAGLSPPPVSELLDAAEPSRLGVDGVLAPCPAHHALLLAAHAWEHEPLRRLIDLIDVAAVAGEADRATVRALARRWRCERVWRSTESAMAAVLDAGSVPVALRTWACHLRETRERTVLESRVQRLAGPVWALPARAMPRAMARATATHLRRHDGEPWRAKLMRTRTVVRNVGLPRSEHDRLLGGLQPGGQDDPLHTAHGRPPLA